MKMWIKEYDTENFKNKYHYTGSLGALYNKENTEFILWSPVADDVEVIIYSDDNEEMHKMIKGKNGDWKIDIKGDLKNTYYNYLVKYKGIENLVVDPYAKAVGVNGEKAMVVDLESTNPNNWNNDKKPTMNSPLDAIIYEIHIRDFSIDENSGVKNENKGKYLGLVEEGTVIPGTDIKTTFDHLKELGITHIHLLPIFDYKSVDESKLNDAQYNWGYDPQNYNSLEGSYSSNPFDGNLRIKEFKEAVLKIHESGIRIVMDVVYNHTFDTETSCLNLAMPYYYHRTNENGEFSNGSACGNELASERYMVRKYIVDSIIYLAKEYHIDGFRFDLMGLHDIETMKEIRRELDKIDTSIIIYGEGWTGGDTSLKHEDSAIKVNTPKFDKMQIACFSNDIRDGIKGDVFKAEIAGFVNGAKNQEETIKAGVVAFTNNNNIDYQKVLYSDKYWANEPYQTINYDSAHDNYTLWDKLQISSGDATKEELVQMNKLAAAIVLTSQGIPFLHGGEEFLRSKRTESGELEENSYKSPDSVNKLDWNRKKDNIEIFNYYKGLIELRKNYKEFRFETTKDIQEKLRFLNKGEAYSEDSVVAFSIKDKEEFIVIYNANKTNINVNIPHGNWGVLVDGNQAGTKTLNIVDKSNVLITGLSTYVLRQI